MAHLSFLLVLSQGRRYIPKRKTIFPWPPGYAHFLLLQVLGREVTFSEVALLA